jgi:hypothetical protein
MSGVAERPLDLVNMRAAFVTRQTSDRSACATSSSDGTKWQGAGLNASPVMSSMESAAFCASNACHSMHLRRAPHRQNVFNQIHGIRGTAYQGRQDT